MLAETCHGKERSSLGVFPSQLLMFGKRLMSVVYHITDSSKRAQVATRLENDKGSQPMDEPKLFQDVSTSALWVAHGLESMVVPENPSVTEKSVQESPELVDVCVQDTVKSVQDSAEVGLTTDSIITLQMDSRSAKPALVTKESQTIKDPTTEIRNLEKELHAQQQRYTESIALIKAQYDLDYKHMTSKYKNDIAKLQKSHREMLKGINQDHIKVVEAVHEKLKMSKVAIEALEKEKQKAKTFRRHSQSPLSADTFKCVDIKGGHKTAANRAKPPPPAPSEIPDSKIPNSPNCEYILNKILRCGTELLSAEELQLLHVKTCQASAPFVDKNPPIEVMYNSADGNHQRSFYDQNLFDKLMKADSNHERNTCKKFLDEYNDLYANRQRMPPEETAYSNPSPDNQLLQQLRSIQQERNIPSNHNKTNVYERQKLLLEKAYTEPRTLSKYTSR